MHGARRRERIRRSAVCWRSYIDFDALMREAAETISDEAVVEDLESRGVDASRFSLPLAKLDFAAANVAWQRRDCQYFERHRTGASFETHLDIQHRREERFWTAGVALVSAIIGGLIATLPSLIWGDRLIEVVVR